MTYKDIQITKGDSVIHIKLTREKSLNALRNLTLKKIADVLHLAEKYVVISGGESVFAAGRDNQEMQKLSPISSLQNIRSDYWKVIRQIANGIAKKSSFALKLTKEAALNALEPPLEQGFEHERSAFSILTASADRQECINIFIEKRPPNYI